MNGGRDGQRILCPRCQANNFLGQAQCWQCGGTLPPPGAAARPMPQQRATGPYPAAAPSTPPASVPVRAQPSRPGILLFASIAVLTFVVVLLVAIRTRSTAPAINPAPSPPASGPIVNSQSSIDNNAADNSIENRKSKIENPVADPLTEAARNVIERESSRLGLPSSSGAVSPDGRIHLRSGGSITPEEWNAAHSKLQASPLLNPSPVPPGY